MFFSCLSNRHRKRGGHEPGWPADRGRLCVPAALPRLPPSHRAVRRIRKPAQGLVLGRWRSHICLFVRSLVCLCVCLFVWKAKYIPFVYFFYFLSGCLFDYWLIIYLTSYFNTALVSYRWSVHSCVHKRAIKVHEFNIQPSYNVCKDNVYTSYTCIYRTIWEAPSWARVTKDNGSFKVRIVI